MHFSHPTDKKIKQGEFVLLDCGAFYEGGYATDITRTFMNGEPSKEQKEVYTTVLRAFLRAYNADLSKYKTCYEIDKIARDFLDKNAPKGYVFGHGLGHSVGRCVHDGLPTVSPSPLAKMKIKKNMVFTIEPMINTGTFKCNIDAKDGWTVRTADGGLSAQWEHTLGITEDGVIIFTEKMPHD